MYALTLTTLVTVLKRRLIARSVFIGIVLYGPFLFASLQKGKCELCEAIAERNISHIERQLTKWNSDINQGDSDGNTPLHYCVELGEMELFEKLIENGADLYKRNKNGDSPLHRALAKNNTEVLKVVASQVANSLRANEEYWDYWRWWRNYIGITFATIGMAGAACFNY